MHILCLDMEGVLTPEIWINVAERTGIEALQATTRDIPDYDVLMRQRLRILEDHKLGISDIQDVIATLDLLSGAREFLDRMRKRYQVVILSDTFYDFATPFVVKMNYPTLFCHRLEIDERGMIANYHLRMDDQKRHAVNAFRALNFKVVAAGDSYNDTTMLTAAHAGILFRPPQNVIDEFPQFPVTTDYQALEGEVHKAFAGSD